MGTRYKGSRDEVRALNAYITLLRAAESVSTDMAVLFSGYHLTPSQFGVLDALFHLGPMHQNELAHKILKTNGNLTMVISNLSKRGLIRRRRDDKDRRCITVALTPTGRELIQKVMPIHVEAIAKRFAVLNSDEQENLRNIARRLGTSEP